MFGHKKGRERILKNKQIIEDNANQINVLITLAESEPELVEELKDIQNELRYLNPIDSHDAEKYDSKIADKIGDTKILLTKAERKEDFTKAYDAVKELKYLTVERKNVRLN